MRSVTWRDVLMLFSHGRWVLRDKLEMREMANRVLADLALPYRVQYVAEPEQPGDQWRFRFFDPTAPVGRQIFQIAVEAGMPDGQTKAALATGLVEQENSGNPV